MSSPQIVTYETLVADLHRESMTAKRWWAFWMVMALASVAGGIVTFITIGPAAAAVSFVILLCSINMIGVNTSQAELIDAYLQLLQDWAWDQVKGGSITPPPEMPLL